MIQLRHQGREIMNLFRRLNEEGTPIVQLTRNADWAQFGRRSGRLEAGWIEP